MVGRNTPHDALMQATLSYAPTPEIEAEWWRAIDTSMHPAVANLVEAIKATMAQNVPVAREALAKAGAKISADNDADLYLVYSIFDAKLLALEKGVGAGMKRLAAEEQRFGAASPVVRMASHWRLGLLCRGAGLLAEAFNHITEAQSVALANGWEFDLALLTSELGGAYLEAGDPVKAITQLEKAVHELTRLGDMQYTDLIMMNLALAHGRVGETDTAETLLADALSRQRKHAPFHRVVSALLNLATIKMRLGKTGEAGDIYREVLLNTEADAPTMARVRALIGIASIRSNETLFGEALEYLEQARTLASELGQPVMALDIDAKRADVHRDLGNKAQAVELLQATFAELCKHSYTLYTINAGSLLEHWLVEDGLQGEAYAVLKICSDLQREMYKQESERALQLSEVRQTVEAERKSLSMREAERRTLLQQVLPLPIADRIMAGEQRIAEQIEMVGILFADIVGFTQSSAGKPPGEVLEFLEELFRSVDHIVAKHGCAKIKSIGDSYMATSGTTVGVSREEATASIVRLAQCGLDMIGMVSSSRHANVQFRLGMHAGPVVAGVMSGMRLAYDMWGDTVNVASRMESTSLPGRFQTTSVVAEMLREQAEFTIVNRDAIHVKGRGEMETFWITRTS